MLPQHNIRKPYNYGIMFDPAGGSGRGQGGVTSSCIKHRWDQRVSLDFSFSGHNKRNNQRRELRWHMQREKGAGAGITESLSTPFQLLPLCRCAPLFVIASLTPQFTCDKIITMLPATDRER